MGITERSAVSVRGSTAAVLSLFVALETGHAAPATAPRESSSAAPVGIVQRAGLRYRIWARDFDLGDQRFRLSGSAAKSRRSMGAMPIFIYDRVASWTLSGRYDHDIGTSGSIGLVGAMLIERRRPAGLLSSGRPLDSSTMSASLKWIGAHRQNLSLGAFRSGNGGSRVDWDRAVELASGAPLDASGIQMTGDVLAWAPTAGGDRGATLGFDARLQRVAAADAELIGEGDAARTIDWR